MPPIWAVDLFPRTRQKSDINLGLSSHCESVVLLVRQMSTKEYVTIDVKPEELELGNLHVGGTYEEIRKYVLDKFGLKVSTLYISQVKRKCGLDVGEAYMKPKKEDSRVPQCPPEKEKAIIDALHHFGMLK